MDKILLNVVFGMAFNEKMSNFTNFYTSIIPQVGCIINLKAKSGHHGGKFIVKQIFYDYSNVMETNDEDNGNEMIFVFVEPC